MMTLRAVGTLSRPPFHSGALPPPPCALITFVSLAMTDPSLLSAFQLLAMSASAASTPSYGTDPDANAPRRASAAAFHPASPNYIDEVASLAEASSQSSGRTVASEDINAPAWQQQREAAAALRRQLAMRDEIAQTERLEAEAERRSQEERARQEAEARHALRTEYENHSDDTLEALAGAYRKYAPRGMELELVLQEQKRRRRQPTNP